MQSKLLSFFGPIIRFLSGKFFAGEISYEVIVNDADLRSMGFYPIMKRFGEFLDIR